MEAPQCLEDGVRLTQNRAVDIGGQLHVRRGRLPLISEPSLVVLVSPRHGSETLELELDLLFVIPAGSGHQPSVLRRRCRGGPSLAATPLPGRSGGLW